MSLLDKLKNAQKSALLALTLSLPAFLPACSSPPKHWRIVSDRIEEVPASSKEVITHEYIFPTERTLEPTEDGTYFIPIKLFKKKEVVERTERYNITEFEMDTQNGNPIKRREVQNRGTIEKRKTISEELIPYTNKRVKVKIFKAIGGESTIREGETNEEGTLIFNSKEMGTPFNWESNKRDLEERLKSREHPITKEITPETLPILERKIFEKIGPSRVIAKIIILGSEENAESPIYSFEGFTIHQNNVYPIITKFVDEQINSRIAPVTFRMRDKDDRSPLRGGNYTLTANTSPKEELVASHFTGELAHIALQRIKDYQTGTTEVQNLSTSQTFQLYLPDKVLLEATRKGYEFFEGEVHLDRNHTDKILDMPKVGQKMKVEIIDSTEDKPSIQDK